MELKRTLTVFHDPRGEMEITSRRLNNLGAMDLSRLAEYQVLGQMRSPLEVSHKSPAFFNHPKLPSIVKRRLPTLMQKIKKKE